MTREEMWKEFESQLISEVRTPITMSYNDSIRIAEIGIKEVVKRWKKRLEQEPKTGYWIDTGSGQECSKCHEIQYGYDNHRFYCGSCGAKMAERSVKECLE